jgi:phosphate-selective porin OprO/OprP
MTDRSRLWLLVTASVLLSSSAVLAQAPPPAAPAPSEQPPILDETIDAAQAEETRTRLFTRWNHYEGPLFSVRVGGGVLYDYAGYSQDEASEEQFPDLNADGKLRDFRVLFRGALKFKRKTTWSAGVMYDAANEEWVMRQTGIMVSVPEIWGDIFVGRTKEGFSLNKVMIGYAGWAMERAPMSDASLPILADGVKWLGYLPKARLLWNLGVYGDTLSESQGFSTYENQVISRIAWLPIAKAEGRKLMHVGFSWRYGKPKDDTLRLRARPGAWPAPYFQDTGQFPAKSTTMSGFEIYYRPGRWTFGSEFFFQQADAPEVGDPFFHGGEAVVSWILTGETRTYNVRGGYFNPISPSRPIYGGGPGAWEIVLHATYADFDDELVKGGTYWRFTPMLNWYLSDHMRLEAAYGYGSLDRFSLVGRTHFFQTRVQLTM